jgi:RNA polymerase subunit RPABC4/transcription elongation factor Spt4
MPAYKVPCPRCGNFIMRDVAVCPFCRTADPFAPARCPNCHTVLEDPRWSVCPSCGTENAKPAAASAPTTAGAGPSTPAGQAPAAAQPSAPAAAPPGPAAAACKACGAPLVSGAPVCNVCGTQV